MKVRFSERVFSAMALRAAAEKRTISDWVRCLVEVELGVVGDSVEGVSEPEVVPVPGVLSESLSPTSSTGGDATVTVASEAEGVDLSPSSGEGLSTESDELASLLAGMEDFSPDR